MNEIQKYLSKDPECKGLWVSPDGRHFIGSNQKRDYTYRTREELMGESVVTEKPETEKKSRKKEK